VSNHFRNTASYEPLEPIVTPEAPPTPSPKRKRKRWKKLMINGIAVLFGGALITLLAFAGKEQNAETCWKVEVEIEPVDGKYFLDQKDILALVNTKNDSVIGKKVKSIQIEKIHQRVSSNPSVANADVFTTVDGRVVVKIKQRQPIARVFNQDGSSFYIDKSGFVMPVRSGAAMKLPVFVGNIDETIIKESLLEKKNNASWARKSMLDDMYYLTLHITESEFAQALIDHIYVDGSRNLILIPRVGDHKIYLGNATQLEEKFKKLQTFYASTLNTHDLNAFHSIHLEYRGQVVCERK
jgi:cell division protein FtsQ